MSKDNYDDWAVFCGDKDFYDIDGDGHLDWIEASMMMSDVDEELKEFESSNRQNRYNYQQQKKSGCSFGLIMTLSIISWIIQLISDAGKGIVDIEGTFGGIVFLVLIFVIRYLWVNR